MLDILLLDIQYWTFITKVMTHSNDIFIQPYCIVVYRDNTPRIYSNSCYQLRT